jgi:hypothetical protein
VKLLISIEGHLSYTLSVEDHNLHRMHLLRVPGKHFFFVRPLMFWCFESCFLLLKHISHGGTPQHLDSDNEFFFFFFDK